MREFLNGLFALPKHERGVILADYNAAVIAQLRSVLCSPGEIMSNPKSKPEKTIHERLVNAGLRHPSMPDPRAPKQDDGKKE